jgi:hypothetical protein
MAKPDSVALEPTRYPNSCTIKPGLGDLDDDLCINNSTMAGSSSARTGSIACGETTTITVRLESPVAHPESYRDGIADWMLRG